MNCSRTVFPSVRSGRPAGAAAPGDGPVARRCCPAPALWAVVLAGALPLAALAQPVEDSLAQRLKACTACHGATDVVRADAYFPRLAGKPAAYLAAQLRNFRDGRRHYAPMQGLLAGLPEAYLDEIAGYFAAQTPAPHSAAPAPVPTTAASLAAGERLVRQGLPERQVPACAACHGQALTGVLPAVPGLLGLPRNYLAAQLGAWRGGLRHAQAPDCMAEVVRRVPADDLAAAVAWLASQPVPADARPAPRATGPAPLPCGGLAGTADRP